jgi:hypothetical protein
MSWKNLQPEANKYARVLDAHGISRVEFVILRAVALGPFPFYGFDTCVAELWRDIVPFARPARRILSREIARCIENGFVRIVDEATIAEIKGHHAEKASPSPLYGWPEVGALDFTIHGAATYLSIQRALGHNSKLDDFEVYLRRTENLYFATEERAQKELAAAAECIGEVAQVMKIGPWRARWWERHEAGVMAKVVFCESKNA